MTMLLDLPQAAAKSGLRVVLVPGWRTRTRPGGMAAGAPDGVVVHHTATSARAAGNYPTMGIIKGGRDDGLKGPLAQLGLGRDGTVYVVAAGRANHAGRTDTTAASNSHAIGIEAEHPGVGPWPEQQYKAYVALCAALADHYGLPTSRVRGHKEVAVPHGRKNDPNFDMAEFRRAVDEARRVGPAKTVDVPPRDPRYGHRGVPKPLIEDGIIGSRTIDALLWDAGGDRLDGLSRANVRAVQSWAGRPRTGVLDKDDVKAIQGKVGSPADGVWPRRAGQKSDTTLRIQKFLNHRIKEQNR